MCVMPYLTLEYYIDHMRGRKERALTRREAEILHIPFPLTKGWLDYRKHMIILEDRLELLNAARLKSFEIAAQAKGARKARLARKAKRMAKKQKLDAVSS